MMAVAMVVPSAWYPLTMKFVRCHGLSSVSHYVPLLGSDAVLSHLAKGCTESSVYAKTGRGAHEVVCRGVHLKASIPTGVSFALIDKLVPKGKECRVVFVQRLHGLP